MTRKKKNYTFLLFPLKSYSSTGFRKLPKIQMSEVLHSMKRFQFLIFLKLKNYSELEISCLKNISACHPRKNYVFRGKNNAHHIQVKEHFSTFQVLKNKLSASPISAFKTQPEVSTLLFQEAFLN